MINTIKFSVMLLSLLFLMVLPMVTSAWADQDRHDEGRSHHRHEGHFHANPNLTLISGMDSIDSRVLVDPAVDPQPEVIEQPMLETVAGPVQSQYISSDAEGNFIVNVPNNAGGYTPIRIQKLGNGYVGPQGEFYYPFPQVTQLKAMYGL